MHEVPPCWVEERLNEHEVHAHKIKRIHFEVKTALQSVRIAELERYGLTLLLDGRLQSTQYDEQIYHECIVFPAYVRAGNASRVLCIGGANGGIIREIAKIPVVKRIELIDLDEAAFRACRHYLPHMFAGEDASDTRIVRHFGNPRAILPGLPGDYDLIYNDVADSILGSPSRSFYAKEYFETLKSKVAPTGLLVTQAGPANPVSPAFFASVLRTVSECFTEARPYTIEIPSYGVPWSFIISGRIVPVVTATEVDGKLSHLNRPSLTAYDGVTDVHMFSLAKAMRNALERSGRVITDAALLNTFQSSENEPQ